MKQYWDIACRALTIGSALTSVLAAAEPAKVEFNRQIRPILADKCFVCHGPDAGTRKAKLRLDLREEALKERRDIRPIVPGEPDKSEVIARIFAVDEQDRMPPVKSRLALTTQEKEVIREWIKQGAEYQPHWSFIPVPGKVAVPPVKDAAWPRSDLDRFVLARLEVENLKPSPEASRERWLRRVTFDLTGLPPTQPEITIFLADSTSQAHERVVDRLLASPRFGEKMAVHWLDAARYADSFGYQADLDTHSWPYRDWVIKAFNDNLSFDRFIVQQLAGDLLPKATRSERLATAFLRIHRKTQEGGSVEQEFRQDGISDRVHTIGTALLGLTVECARCHDHKYDPITMRDYYSLGAFFNSIDEWGLLHGKNEIQPHPVLYLTTPEQDAALAKQREAIAEAETAIVKLRQSREASFRQWLTEKHPDYVLPVDLQGSYDLQDMLNGNLRNAAKPEEPGKFEGADRFVPAKIGSGVMFSGDDPISLTHGNCRHMSDPISAAFWLMPGEDYPRAVVFHNTDGWDPGYNGYELLIEHGQLRWMFAREWPGNCIAVRTRDKVPTNAWTHVAVTYDGSSRAAGLRVYLNGQPASVEVLRDKLVKDCGDIGKIDFGERRRDNGLRGGAVDEISIFSRVIAPIEVAQVFDGESLVNLITKTERTEPETAALREYYLSAVDADSRAVVESLHKARNALRETMDQVREVPVMEEQAEPRPTYLLVRGAYDAPSDQVSRATPGSLPPFPADAPRNRLGLAQWLTQRNHPLTGRVEVNRIWQEFFGRGLVPTSENFGTQGQQPSHPELLDWLARDFIDHGWDFKRFCKQIVLSATYRQDSRASKELLAKDPENILLARGPAKRLGAEMLRDNALALGGLLRPEVGGPPVKPYEPEGSMWRTLNSFLPEYQRDTGAGLYRRSLYTFWRRTTPPPNMLVFDSATRDVCAARRQLTLTPLQPLVLLNDPQFVEAARALGERMLTQGGGTIEQRIDWLFREVTGRTVTPNEMNLLHQLYDEQLAGFKKDVPSAEKFLKVGDYKPVASRPAEEMAAAATTAGAMLNLDATIVVR